MARDSEELPYPPSPTNVPEDLAIATPKFMFQATLLVLCLFLFVLFYFGLMGLCGYGVYWGLTAETYFLVPRIGAIVLGAFMLLFLVKGFFVRETIDRDEYTEITEDDAPLLFEFIEELCAELKAPFPNQIFISAEVNAAMFYRVSFFNLIVPPKKNLLLGLGLVNALNLSEFKAVVAHELGHYAQKSFISAYSYVALRIIEGVLGGRDWIDYSLERARSEQNLIGAVASFFWWILHGIRRTLYLFYKGIAFLNFLISRQREFNADLVAVSVAGSDAIVHGLKRTAFAHTALIQAVRELQIAADHKLYTRDLFYHQTSAAEYIRKIEKKPNLGKPPELKGLMDGKKIQVFDPEEEENAPMWDYHPSMYDREENAKEVFIPAVMDTRSPWVLFGDADDIKERVTYKFYRLVYKVSKNVELEEPEKIQKFIDDEHAETTYGEQYHGIYDGRPIWPGNLTELDEQIRNEPWENDRLDRVEKRLYENLEKKAEDYQDTRKEYNELMRNCQHKPTGKLKRTAMDLEDQLEKHREWFRSFDRRVYFVYVQMAKALPDKSSYEELKRRYQFHIPIQTLHLSLQDEFEKAEAYAIVLFNSGQQDISQAFLAEAMHVFRQARKALRNSLREARDLDIPNLKNFTGDEALDEFLLSEKLIKELPENYISYDWAVQLLNQMTQVSKKSARLHFKSLGNILSLQEQIAKEFRAVHASSGLAESDLLPPEALPTPGDQPKPADGEEPPEAPPRKKAQVDDDEPDAPPPRSKRRTDDDDADEAPRKKKRLDDDDDEPRSRKRRGDDDEDEAPRKKKRLDDDDDDEPRSRRRKDDDDDEPRRRKR